MNSGINALASRPRPLSLAEMLWATFRVYRRGFVAFLIVMGIAAVPEEIFSATYDLIVAYTESTDGAERSLRALTMSLLVHVLAFLVNGGYSVVSEALFGGIAIVLASNPILGRPADVVESCRQALRRLGPLVLVVGVPWLVMLVLGVTILGIPFAIYVGLGWMLTSQVVLLEGLGWRDALRRSWDMARWHRRRLLACYVVVALAQIVPYVLLYNIPSCLFTSGVGGDSWLQGCPVAEDASTLVSLADVVLRGLIGALVQPLAPIVVTLLYYDLRVRDERLDLDLRAAVSDRVPAP